MPKTKTHHVVPNKTNGGWDVKKGGSKKASKHANNKKDAEKIARKISKNQNSELIIHKKDGTIQRKDSHGEDSFPPKG
jgi:hypothetical protein